jgi:hypothetical protein
MTEALRHYCRNPRCRSKLSAPVSNAREAFCARGCHTQFYRTRCIVCERPMERTIETRQLCGRPRCRSQFATLKAYFSLGRYHPSSHALDASRNPIKPSTFSRLKTDRGWRQVAGPAVDIRLAAIGADDALKHADKVNRRHWADASAAALIQRHHAPVNVVGGYKFPGAPVVDIGVITKQTATAELASPIAIDGDPLAIPDFLLRTQPTEAMTSSQAQITRGTTEEFAA